MQLLLDEETTVVEPASAAELMSGFSTYTDAEELAATRETRELVASGFFCATFGTILC